MGALAGGPVGEAAVLLPARRAAARTSSGDGATRWLVRVSRTTTSHSLQSMAVPSSGIDAHSLEPTSGKSSTSLVSATSGSTTTGSGS